MTPEEVPAVQVGITVTATLSDGRTVTYDWPRVALESPGALAVKVTDLAPPPVDPFSIARSGPHYLSLHLEDARLVPDEDGRWGTVHVREAAT